jgi:O-antigen/teichoic acid export membrane protein
MRSRLSSLFKNTVLKNSFSYVLFGGINSAIPFLLLPIITKYLSPAEYGTVAVYQLLIGFTVPLIGFNMGMNIDRNFFKIEKEKLSVIIFNMLFILNITLLLALVIVYLILQVNSNALGVPPGWAFSLPVIAAMMVINEFNLIILRNQNKARTYGVWQIVLTILNISISLLLIISFHYGWEGRAYGIMLSSLIVGGFSLYSLYKDRFITIKISKEDIRETLIICLPLIFHSLGGMIIFMSDRFFLDRLVSKEAVGIYSVAYAFGSIVGLVQDSASKAFVPWLYKKLSNATYEDKIEIVKYTYYYYACLLGVTLLIALASYIVLPFMTASTYSSAARFIVWICLGLAINGMYKMISPYFIYRGKTNTLALITFTAAVVNILCCIFLIKLNGAIGASQAMLISFLVSFLLSWFFSNKIYPMPWLSYFKLIKK